jgi:hypothetical protein
MPRDRNGNRGPRNNVESFITGLVIAGGAFAYWFLAPGPKPWWLAFVAFFGGFLPAARGLSGMIASRGAAPAAKRLGERERAAEHERIALSVAREKGGRITPSLVVLASEMTVEEAERALDSLAKKGHAAVRIRDDGRIEYEFSEFLPGPPG